MKLLLALALILLLPGASAGVPFLADVEDPRDDVTALGHGSLSYPSGDILRATSTVMNGSVVQRVQMAARPVAPNDTILVRSWFHNSTNGSFHAIDMPVEGSAPDPAKRFLPVMRRGSFDNATAIPARYGLVDNTTWIFEFNASLVEDATCFTIDIIAVHTPKRGLQGFDTVEPNGDCATSAEPIPDLPPVVAVSVPREPVATPPTGEPPGGAPTPLPAGLALAGLGLALFGRRRSR